MDVFGRVVAVMLLVAMTVTIPIGFVVVKTEKAKQRYAEELMEQFLEEIRRDGEITLEEWEKLQADLSRNGILYDVEISIGSMDEGMRAE